MRRIAILCSALIAFALPGCNSSDHDSEVKALRDTETQWNQSYVFKDPEKIVSYYTDDAVLMVPGMPPSHGKAAIRNAIKTMVGDPALSLKFNASNIEVSKSGDLAYTQGTYTMTMTDPQTKKVINDHGSYVTTYRKQSDGSWKAVADIATSEVPPPVPASAP